MYCFFGTRDVLKNIVLCSVRIFRMVEGKKPLSLKVSDGNVCVVHMLCEEYCLMCDRKKFCNKWHSMWNKFVLGIFRLVYCDKLNKRDGGGSGPGYKRRWSLGVGGWVGERKIKPLCVFLYHNNHSIYHNHNYSEYHELNR